VVVLQDWGTDPITISDRIALAKAESVLTEHLPANVDYRIVTNENNSVEYTALYAGPQHWNPADWPHILFSDDRVDMDQADVLFEQVDLP
jgi:hypothetical protein